MTTKSDQVYRIVDSSHGEIELSWGDTGWFFRYPSAPNWQGPEVTRDVAISVAEHQLRHERENR